MDDTPKIESNTARAAPIIRRIVTGHDAQGKAIVWKDGPATFHKFPNVTTSSTLMWVTQQSPCDFLDDVDHGQSYSGTPPPPGGTRMGVIEILPGEHRPPLHRTDTLDYVICIAGEMGMLLDDGVEVFMRTGDIMIQRGTAHAWFNRGSEPARIAFILVDGAPQREGSIQRGGSAT
jgi:quercetin dioxygenase-like cupin family protein